MNQTLTMLTEHFTDDLGIGIKMKLKQSYEFRRGKSSAL